MWKACLWCLTACSIPADAEKFTCNAAQTEDESLLSLRGVPAFASPNANATQAAAVTSTSKESCLAMRNHGSHFTVEIGIGTPEQRFSVIADTGSSLLVVIDCSCLELGSCDPSGRCYQGTGKSSSFLLARDAAHHAIQRKIRYGSGAVSGVLASEAVRVGQLHVNVSDGMLLVVDSALRLSPDMRFEGIMGLGLPIPHTASVAPKLPPTSKALKQGMQPSTKMRMMPNRQLLKRLMNRMKKHFMNGNPGARAFVKPSGQVLPADAVERIIAPLRNEGLVAAEVAPMISAAGNNHGKGVFWQGDVDRFGMCFASRGGTLKINQAPPAMKLSNMGTLHWGVGLHGISVGETHVATSICVPGSDLSGASTPCAAVPDSGTTLIMAPPRQLAGLVGHICDNWSRCTQKASQVKNATASVHVAALEPMLDRIDSATLAKFHAFHELLEHCGEWMTEKGGLKELPSIALNVSGKGPSESQVLELVPHAYVFEVQSNKSDTKHGEATAMEEHDTTTGAAEANKTCRAAFGPMTWTTPANGPVWILGLPLFYSYSVGYELTDKALSFTETTKQSPCAVCAGASSETSLVAEDAATNGPWWRLSGSPRMPSYDTSLPL